MMEVEAEASPKRASGTLSRPRMLVAAAPTTRKQVSATIVMALVKKVSIPPVCRLPEN